jgi:hypothetical protein
LIGFSERGLDAEGNLQSFIIGGPRPGSFSVQRTDDYDITDAALLPDGDLLLLERKFPCSAESPPASDGCRSKLSSRARWWTVR